jgi:hypothetical protein
MELILLGTRLEVGLIMSGSRRRYRFESIFGSDDTKGDSRRSDRPSLVVGQRGLLGSAVTRYPAILLLWHVQNDPRSI